MIAVVLSVVVLGPPAGAQTVLGRAGEQLRRDKVYVDPAAERRIDDDAERRLEEQIRQADTPIFVAVLPGSATAEAGGNVNAVPGELARAVGLSGTYAVIAGSSFRADSDTLNGAPGIASAVFDRSKSTEEVLSDFITRAERAAAGGAASGSEGGSSERSGDDGGGGGGGGAVLPLLLLIGAGAVGLLGEDPRTLFITNNSTTQAVAVEILVGRDPTP